jgi:hypothetical protein
MSDVSVTVGDIRLSHASTSDVAELEKALRPGDEGFRANDDDDGDAKPNKGDDGDGERVARGSGRDEEMEDATTETERDAIRERRRQERIRRKQNNRDRTDALLRRQASLESQNREMAEQLRRLTQNDSAAQMAQLDSAITEAATVHENAKQAHSAAVARSDGETASKAMDVLLAARDRFNQLTGIKNQITAPQTPKPSPIDPIVNRAATAFAKDNKWYKGPRADDPDSQVLTLLDNAIAKEGFDPKTPEYWDELEARGAVYLPHRFNGPKPATRRTDSDAETDQDENGYTTAKQQRPRSPVGGASQRGNAPVNSEGEFRLSSERVMAMKEAGIWDDPERRKKMIAEYRKVDSRNS